MLTWGPFKKYVRPQGGEPKKLVKAYRGGASFKKEHGKLDGFQDPKWESGMPQGMKYGGVMLLQPAASEARRFNGIWKYQLRLKTNGLWSAL